MTYDQRNRILAVGTQNGNLVALDESGNILIDYTVDHGAIRAVAFDQSGANFTAISDKRFGRFRIFPERMFARFSLNIIKPEEIEHLACRRVVLSPDGSRLAVLRPDFGIDIWTSRGKSVLSRPNDGENREEQENRAINAFEFSPEGQYLALHSRDGHVTLVDSSTGTSIFTSSDTQYFPLMGSYESDDCARDFNWKGRNRLHFQTGTTAAEWEIFNNRNTDRSSSQFRVKTISDAAVDFGFDGRSVTSENGTGGSALEAEG